MSDTPSHNINPKYAWRELPRTEEGKRPAAERLADFLEIYGHYDEETACEQASRCIQCPDPVCVSACPLGSQIPEWLALTADGHFSEAAALLHSTSSLSEIVTRVCPSDRLCEAMCILDGKAEPVSILAIEQFLSDYAFGHGEADVAALPPNGKSVAVIGAGPGGLACSDALMRRGFAVTVFDWRLVPGGLLVSGTPGFHLERSIVERRVEILRKHGVKFRLGVRLGEDFTYDELRSGFDAIFMGFGARQPREVDVPGRDLTNVTQSLMLLLQEHTGPAQDGSQIDVTGKRVVVVGGGNMALDCLRTALRSGAGEAVCVYRRDEVSMTCSHAEFTNAVEEGGTFIFCAAPKEVLGNERGEVSGLRLLRTELGAPDADGRKSFKVIEGSEFKIPADHVFFALGFEPVPLPHQSPFDTLGRNAQGGVAVDDRQMTSIPGVFAGGDLVRGPGSVLNVVRDARRAAQGIEAYLAGGEASRPHHCPADLTFTQ